MRKKISIVTPVFNEEENLREFYTRLTKVMSGLSYDMTLFLLMMVHVILLQPFYMICHKMMNVQAYLLSRNFGHQMALTCGLDRTEGDAVITMDGDLQHPPELLPELLSLWEGSYEIIQTVRKDTADASFFKKITSSTYYKLINKMSKVHITPGGSVFRLMDRVAVDALKLYSERARFIRGIVNNLGF